MLGFFSTYTNKIDSKGRISVPASFRQTLSLDAAIVNFNGFIAFPSFRQAAIECWTPSRMHEMMDQVGSLDVFSESQENFQSAIFAESREIPIDNDGRIILPDYLKEHAGIKDQAVFVGCGRTFQIWTSENYDKHRHQMKEKMQKTKPTLALGKASS